MTSVNRRRWLSALLMLVALAGCGPNRVIVDGNFPPPLIKPLPLSLGVWFGDDFARHEFFDGTKSRGESSWVVNTGAAQVQMWDGLLTGMFEQVIVLNDQPEAGRSSPAVAAVLIPHIEELQYAIPEHTQIKVYEIWMRYHFELVTIDGQSIAEWTMSSYGKTPTAFLQSDREAVNLAAVMALRDAGANFSSHFTQFPAVQNWLREQGVPADTMTP
jgi:hypothetical protein